MHDISNPNEARELLSKDDFSLEDSRAILLYLVQRDEQWKQNAIKLNSALLTLFQMCGAFLLSLNHLPLQPSPELRKQLDAAVEAMNDFRDLISPDSLVH